MSREGPAPPGPLLAGWLRHGPDGAGPSRLIGTEFITKFAAWQETRLSK